jgi:uncharacterized RDD family membrane protein YckC
MKATHGVYFRRGDYAGFWLRLLIDVIDVVVAGAVCSALIIPTIAIWAISPTKMSIDLMLATCTVVAFCYFVALKRSKGGTVGYRVGGVRIVGPDGQTASWLALTFRLLFAMLGPLNWLLDLIWLSGDPHRQTIRDKFAQTYIIKRNAEPVGTGKVVYRYYDIFCYNLIFREIEEPQQ